MNEWLNLMLKQAAGWAYLGVYLVCGVLMVRWLLPRHRPLNRVWLGLSFGLLLLMWLPALCAFVLDFTIAAHLCALIPLALVTAGCYFARDKRPLRAWDAEEKRQWRQAVLVLAPLMVYSAYIQWTHVVRIDEYGAWNVGQSTYGDLPMHLSFVTGLKNAAFPPEYPFYPGVQLSYPFLADSLSTTFYMIGWPLQLAVVIPSCLMMGLCYLGVLLLAREMTGGKKAALIAMLLFFLNGGLGFLYDFDQAAGVEYDGTLTVVERLRNIMEGFYKTPTNQPDPNNLRWSNVIVDLMVPQRTLLGGWTMVIPCFYLLYTTFAPSARDGQRRACVPDEPDGPTAVLLREDDRLGTLRSTILLGVWAGALPLLHTHSFLALGLCTAGMMVYDLIHDEERVMLLKRYIVYGVIAVALAAPQLICFTFAQAFQGGETHSFLTLQFNWVNNPGGRGMRDFYFWFYIKNIGLPFIALVLAVVERNPKHRRIFAGALAIILAAEFIRFQPNEYDNNKLFYLAWLLCVMIVADWAVMMYRRMAGLRARRLIAVLVAVATFLSAGLTLARETVSDYQAFSPQSVEAGEFVQKHTEEGATFLTGTQHLNPVFAIGGRKVVCGPDLWLYYHGFNTAERKADIARFMTNPADNLDVLDKYAVDYIYVSSYEVDSAAMDELFDKVFENREATIYQATGG